MEKRDEFTVRRERRRAIGLGWVAHADGVTDAFVATGRWEVEIACERVPARAYALI